MNRRPGALWALVQEPNTPHAVGRSDEMSRMFFDDVLPMRIGAMSKGKLGALDPDKGWQGDLAKTDRRTRGGGRQNARRADGMASHRTHGQGLGGGRERHAVRKIGGADARSGPGGRASCSDLRPVRRPRSPNSSWCGRDLDRAMVRRVGGDRSVVRHPGRADHRDRILARDLCRQGLGLLFPQSSSSGRRSAPSRSSAFSRSCPP